MNERYKKLTLLHSNDLHGDFLAEKIDDRLVGGVSRLSGYIKRCRKMDENVLYCIAGDMFRGSVIDSEYLGISTIEIMNKLSPDVVTIGNHETDYGLAHLLFIEKCANFPIINANMHITTNGQRLFKPYEIISIDGMKILFIGITTEEVIANARQEGIISTFININDASEEVGRICNAFNAIDIDFTVLLTHIGYEEDLKLAKKLDPAWGVDVIIGGHSHTFLKEATKVNDILVVQAGTGTDQIGRFDIIVDTENNCVESYNWKTIPIDDLECPRDEQLEEMIQNIKRKTDLKYERVITRFERELTHPKRHMQTELGSLYSDTLRHAFGVEIYMAPSGCIRKNKLGPIVTYKDMLETFPFTDRIVQFIVDGKQLMRILNHIYRKEAWEKDSHTEFYQLNEGMRVVYSMSGKKILEAYYHDKPVSDETLFIVGASEYHYLKSEDSFGLSKEELNIHQKARIICTNVQDTIIETWSSGKRLKTPVMDRLIFVE